MLINELVLRFIGRDFNLYTVSTLLSDEIELSKSLHALNGGWGRKDFIKWQISFCLGDIKYISQNFFLYAITIKII